MSKTTTRMPAKERAKLQDDDELNQQQAAYYLGIGRSTLGRLVAAGSIRVRRPSPATYFISVADLRAYERQTTSGGTTTPTTTTGAKAK